MTAILIRRAVRDDPPTLESLNRTRVADMARNAIPQWDAFYPTRAIFAADIHAKTRWVHPT